jgi:radical S-adenosyl methionine domain-containing protein 2
MKKLNISSGEPFLKPQFIREIFHYCKEELHLESCSIVNNGSKVTEKWLDTYGRYLDIMAISCDSFDVDTNIQLGRTEKGKGSHVRRVFQSPSGVGTEESRSRSILLSPGQCSSAYIFAQGIWERTWTRLNFQEDMNASIEELSPYRWKVDDIAVYQSVYLDLHVYSV